jgi:HNH endonuclease
MQERAGPLPTWAAAMLILQHAVNEWERMDPSRRPAETPIYERDEYRCQAPGCSARRGLEAHHIIFRSRRGSDDPENLITLCHAHHRQGIHENRLKVSGQAPWNLKWRMGSPGYRWEWPRPGNQSVILSGPS